MSESVGTNEAGKAWVTISIKDETKEGLENLSKMINDFSNDLQISTSSATKKTTTKASSNIESFINKTEKTLKNFTQTTTRILKDFGSGLESIGKGLSGFGATIVAPMALSAKSFADFDDQMREVKATTGASGKNFEELTQKAKNLGATTSFSAAEVAAAMGVIGKSVPNTEFIKEATSVVMNLSRATGTGIESAAEIAIGAMNQFGLESEDFSHICDLLTAGANASALDVADLGESFKNGAPLAKQMGMSIEDTVKVLATLGNLGIKGAQAGTAIKGIQARMTQKEVAPIYADLGVDTMDHSTGKMRNLHEVLLDVGKSVEGMADDEKFAKLQKIFGLEGLAAGANLTATKMKEVEEAIESCAGTAERQAKEMDSGLGGEFRSLSSAIESVKIEIGNALAPVITEISQKVLGYLEVLKSWIEKNKETVASIGHLTASATLIGGAFYGIGAATRASAKTLETLGKLGGGILEFFRYGTSGASKLSIAIGALGKVFNLFKANPVLLALSSAGSLAMVATSKFIATKKAAIELSHEMSKQAELNEKKYASDKDALGRLSELAEKNGINNREMTEANNIILNLSARYGDLGLVLDTIARKIDGVTGAQKRLMEAQSKMRRADLIAKISEEKENIRKAKVQLDYRGLGSKKGRQEWSMEEIRAADRKKIDSTGNNFSGGTLESRSVLNPISGKYIVAEMYADTSFLERQNWSGLSDEEIGQKAKDRLQRKVDNLVASSERLNSMLEIKDSMEDGKDFDAGAKSGSPDATNIASVNVAGKNAEEDSVEDSRISEEKKRIQEDSELLAERFNDMFDSDMIKSLKEIEKFFEKYLNDLLRQFEDIDKEDTDGKKILEEKIKEAEIAKEKKIREIKEDAYIRETGSKISALEDFLKENEQSSTISDADESLKKALKNLETIKEARINIRGDNADTVQNWFDEKKEEINAHDKITRMTAEENNERDSYWKNQEEIAGKKDVENAQGVVTAAQKDYDDGKNDKTRERLSQALEDLEKKKREYNARIFDLEMKEYDRLKNRKTQKEERDFEVVGERIRKRYIEAQFNANERVNDATIDLMSAQTSGGDEKVALIRLNDAQELSEYIKLQKGEFDLDYARSNKDFYAEKIASGFATSSEKETYAKLQREVMNASDEMANFFKFQKDRQEDKKNELIDAQVQYLGGAGSFDAYDIQKMDARPALETAENTRVSAEYVKKLYKKFVAGFGAAIYAD